MYVQCMESKSYILQSTLYGMVLALGLVMTKKRNILSDDNDKNLFSRGGTLVVLMFSVMGLFVSFVLLMSSHFKLEITAFDSSTM